MDDLLDETWVLFSRPPPPSSRTVFMGSQEQHRGRDTWVARFDRGGLHLREALVYEGDRHGATRAEVTPRDFNELCVEAGAFVRYVVDGDGVAVQLNMSHGPLIVALAKDIDLGSTASG